MNILNLPQEMTINILTNFNNPNEVLKKGLVCKQWDRIIKLEVFWQLWFKQNKPDVLPFKSSWKERFTILHNKNRGNYWNFQYFNDYSEDISKSYLSELVSSPDGHLDILQGRCEKPTIGPNHRIVFITDLMTGTSKIIQKESGSPKHLSIGVCYPLMAQGFYDGTIKIYDLATSDSSPLKPIFNQKVSESPLVAIDVRKDSVVAIEKRNKNSNRNVFIWSLQSNQVNSLMLLDEPRGISTVNFIGKNLLYTTPDLEDNNLHIIDSREKKVTQGFHNGNIFEHELREYSRGICTSGKKIAFINNSGLLRIWKQIDGTFKVIMHITAYDQNTNQNNPFDIEVPKFNAKMFGKWIVVIKTFENKNKSELKLWNIKTQLVIFRKLFDQTTLNHLHIDDHRIVVEGVTITKEKKKKQVIEIFDFSSNPMELNKEFQIEGKTLNDNSFKKISDCLKL